jgi:hypothetical protein
MSRSGETKGEEAQAGGQQEESLNSQKQEAQNRSGARGAYGFSS